jgi:hypothetical protein
MRSGPALVGYDGSPAATQALQEAIDLLGPVPLLVVVIWEAGLPFELVARPPSTRHRSTSGPRWSWIGSSMTGPDGGPSRPPPTPARQGARPTPRTWQRCRPSPVIEV